ncbi:MAG: 5-carboxymethyl-2-hydroxymuconate Delta-isomerase [Pseudomonadota bacterium]
MPHLIVEYSANLDTVIDIQTLVHAVQDAAHETGIFPKAGTRTRAERREVYEIADGHDDNGFVHLIVRIGSGRPVEVRKEAGDLIFKRLTAALDEVYKAHPLAISFEMVEIDPDTTWKQNNIQAFLEARGHGSAA